MSRVSLIDPATATGVTADLLARTKSTLGVIPNMAKALAHSPAALEGFLGMFAALKSGALGTGDQERIALAVAEANGCTYCLSAHSQVARNAAKLSDEEILAARQGRSEDPKSAAVLRLVTAILFTRAHLDDTQFAAARQAGLSEEEIVEVIANVVRNIFTNYINEALAVDVEWPLVTPLTGSPIPA
ncbi:carboxymuconolactone decarboxylase family protein [Nocardia yamanashiensis]|uniref:carboxymuconolactone decarboxylase family protein n=1 Tax=Nocardia yamanashiensis TaxID=209247 RepID=UPI001E3E8B00|nr:carboxymuconolactone decarboxylase family protein [Nocardia yamanashiensis]UGT38855.1 carboxymuconolactone decarboxylase family protein [Nocardia yamanashiensis]